ncbi:MAG: hypothetical protein KJ077_27440 [Anaerolineae bacterium]|nr:hypothetical protein [Anaerolineae bacterium]
MGAGEAEALGGNKIFSGVVEQYSETYGASMSETGKYKKEKPLNISKESSSEQQSLSGNKESIGELGLAPPLHSSVHVEPVMLQPLSLFRTDNIRVLLTEGFSDVELRLCYADFRPVHDHLPPNTGRPEIVDRLIQYAEQEGQIGILLDRAKKHNPDTYEKHQPYYSASTSPEAHQQSHSEASYSVADQTKNEIMVVEQDVATLPGVHATLNAIPRSALDEANLIDLFKHHSVEISLNGDFAKFTPEAKAAAIRALASLLNISEKEILILDVEEGSIIIKLVLPAEAAYQLMKLYKTGTPIVIDLGNQEVEVSEVRNNIMLDVESLKRQLVQRLKNLSFLEEQAANYSVAQLPLDLHTQIEKEKEAIEELNDKIQAWEIEVNRPQMPSHHAPASLLNTTSLPQISFNS